MPIAALRETASAAGAEPPAGAALAGMPADLAATWNALLASVQAGSRFLHNYLLKAFPVAFEREELTIGFPPASAQFLPLVDNRKNQDLLAGVLRAQGFRDPRVKFVKAEPPAVAPAAVPAAPPEPPTPASASEAPPAASPATSPEPPAAKSGRPALTRLDPAAFKDDPLIKEALEIFKGRIAQVVAPAPPQS